VDDAIDAFLLVLHFADAVLLDHEPASHRSYERVLPHGDLLSLCPFCQPSVGAEFKGKDRHVGNCFRVRFAWRKWSHHDFGQLQGTLLESQKSNELEKS
jgi:hypothetical protein